MKRIVIIAGPNGAGKTTFAQEFLPFEAACPVFINADLIAAGLAPFMPDTAAFKAGRIMLKEITANIESGHSFAFETTLSGLTYARMIPHWQESGYRVKLIFLTLNHESEAVARVAMRVRQGGHSIPTDVIRRRFTNGLKNFKSTYQTLVDSWQVFDNSGVTPILISEGSKR